MAARFVFPASAHHCRALNVLLLLHHHRHPRRERFLTYIIVPLLVGAAALSLLTYKKPVIATVSPVVSVGVLLLNLSILTSYLFNAQRYDWPFILGNIASSLLLFFSL